jgi:hypothetical protein
VEQLDKAGVPLYSACLPLVLWLLLLVVLLLHDVACS